MVDNAGDCRKIKLKRGRAISVTCPCVIILPEDSPMSAIVLHAILMGQGGQIHDHRAPIDDRPRRAKRIPKKG